MTVAKSKIVRPYASDHVDAATLAYRLSVSESTVAKLECLAMGNGTVGSRGDATRGNPAGLKS